MWVTVVPSLSEVVISGRVVLRILGDFVGVIGDPVLCLDYMQNVYLLRPCGQHYDWGKIGCESAVARLLKAGHYAEAITPTKPYAELWMGDHPNGPCFVECEGVHVAISEFLRSGGFGEIKFLFKVLSVAKALSIQSHPDAALAQKLHAEFPDVYKDPNPKPELAIALTEFEALFGFRPVTEISDFLDTVPELLQIVGLAARDRLKVSLSFSASEQESALKETYSCLMRASPGLVASAVESLVSSSTNSTCPARTLAVRLNSQFPGGDVGVLSVFFLNIVNLLPGECLFMGPNVPHAYLAGDIIECMTSSDNVIRGGLTPKFKDVPTLLSSLDYSSTRADARLQPLLVGGCLRWSPPNVPFAVQKYSLSCGEARRLLVNQSGISIALVVSGAGRVGSLAVAEGSVILLTPDCEHSGTADSDGLELFLAFTPLV